MKGIRGRFGQHRILNSDSDLSKYLLEMKLLSKLTFDYFLEKYNCILIKPLVGPQEVRVIGNDDGFELATGIEVFRFSSKEETYDYLTKQICTKKYYIVQASPIHSVNLYHCRYTLHRKSHQANWKIVQNARMDDSSLQVKDLFHIWKLNSFVTAVAKRLGTAFPNCHTIVVEIAKNGSGDYWITDTVLHERNSKWSQYHSLYEKRSIRPCLPATELCAKKTLIVFLNTYSEVILKPCIGQQGRGIVKLSMTDTMTFEVHEKQNRTVKSDFNELYHYLLEHYLLKKDYIVQQRIPLTEINGCPFDVRVITQLDEGNWIVTGQLVKVAAKDYFVSNRASKLLSLNKAINESDNEVSYEHCRKRIETICKKASKRLWRKNKELSIIGFDIGIDRKGAVWIIEGNYAPSLSMFYMFENNEIHKRISYYIKKHKKSD
ncbi:YheC/YheD family protein [Sporosarcina sp. UB5]|uniref:YheC/YheD family protein n=1 Tax=Sporosarcina sp. UB5 TaxID=3047463 RepID=UPI003D7918D2